MTYVIAGSQKVNGKLQRGVAVVEIADGLSAFDADMDALDNLPRECFTHRRGAHMPEVWPLESAQGTRLAVAAGIAVPQKALTI